VSIIERIKTRWRGETRTHPSVWDKDPALKEAWVKWFRGSGNTTAGIDITPEVALHLPPVFACVRVITETIATLPIHVYRRERESGKTKRIDIDHPLNKILREPNPEMTRVEWMECMIANQEARENAYAQIVWNSAGVPQSLWPIPTDKVRPTRIGDRLAYRVEWRGSSRIVPARDMIHFRPLTMDGVHGVAPITYMRDVFAMGLAALHYGAGVFAGDGLKRVALTMDGSPPQQNGDRGAAFIKQLQEAWRQLYGGGGDRDHKLAVLHSGLKPTEIGINPKDAQLAELLKVIAIEACRAFRVPPTKIMELDRAHFNNIEHMQLDFRTDTALPRCIRIEQELDRKLLRNDEASFIRYNLDGLLRGDYKSRMEGHSLAIQNGILSPNEARDEEDRNPYEGGDVYLLPLNMAPPEEGTEQPEQEQPGVDGDSNTKAVDVQRETRAATRRDARNKIKKQWLPVLVEAYTRLLKREQKDFREAADKFLGTRGAYEFTQWLDEYEAIHPDVVKRILGPAIEGMEMALGQSVADDLGIAMSADFGDWVRGWIDSYAERHAGRSVGELRSLLREHEGNPEALLEEMAKRIENWTNDAACRANDRVTQSDGAVAREIWMRAGVKKIRWNGGDCEFCAQLDGVVIGIENDAFVPKGQSVNVEGKSPIWAGADVLHPPLHPGCDCYLSYES